MDLSGELRGIRNSVQQIVFDLNRIYEQCFEMPEDELLEEMARLVGDLEYESISLDRQLSKALTEGVNWME